MLSPYLSIPATCALVYRAYSHNSLTPAGIAVAALTAIIHAIHPWAVFFNLLCTFFLAGTAVTKVGPPPFYTPPLTNPPPPPPDQKINQNLPHALLLRLPPSSSSEPRTHIQVLANSGTATFLLILHLYTLNLNTSPSPLCWPSNSRKADLLLPVGILANYASVAADTFSSELGILSSSAPRLITSPSLRKVPRGTNGGVSGVGTLAGFGGAGIIAIVSVVCIPWCDDAMTARDAVMFVVALTLWGGLGSILDSLLGGVVAGECGG
ncbi:MAG: hypothetical protein OHK93_005461 [Ramalina farinacea]|uniref:Uncharacterized protein n=1 Tax=Ramalina farinacea TaxID=258253 RepID=A0AA43QGR8_9LECA|nr:hypothetical protein [Ramalina farinacea]